MFTARDRRRLRDSLVEAARHDPGITAAALVGSAASGAEDDWSDIDLALRLVASGEPLTSAREWTATMYDRHGAVHHLDIWAGPALYRVFLLESSLQVDLSFWPDAEFRATEPTFRLLFGTANEPSDPSSPRVDQVAGMGWLYALHARAAIARNRPWQALLMLDGIRDQIVVLACMRHGLDAHHGRGVDRLPASELEALEPTRARDLGARELRRSLTASLAALIDEISGHDPALAERLTDPVRILGAPG